MNLKDWDAMSRKEKMAFWEKSNEAERQGLVEAGIKKQEDQEALPREPFPFGGRPMEKGRAHFSASGVPLQCENALLELRNALKREIDDEASAAAKYAEMARKLSQMSRPVKADILNLISGQEALHRQVLECIVKDITSECG